MEGLAPGGLYPPGSRPTPSGLEINKPDFVIKLMYLYSIYFYYMFCIKYLALWTKMLKFYCIE